MLTASERSQPYACSAITVKLVYNMNRSSVAFHIWVRYSLRALILACAVKHTIQISSILHSIFKYKQINNNVFS